MAIRAIKGGYNTKTQQHEMVVHPDVERIEQNGVYGEWYRCKCCCEVFRAGLVNGWTIPTDEVQKEFDTVYKDSKQTTCLELKKIMEKFEKSLNTISEVRKKYKKN